jgi:uncharacterized protein DUF4180
MSVRASDVGVAIRSQKDIASALGASSQHGGLILSEADFSSEFFDLRTGLAGELFQKLVNYRARAAIVVPDPRVHGERFAELAYEHRTHPVVRFFASEREAAEWLQTQDSP